MYLSQFRYSHLLEKGMALHLNKLECPSPKDALLQDWLKLDRWFWRWRFFNFVNVFLLFCYYLPLEKVGALHLNKLESSSPKNTLLVEFGPVVLEKKMLCAKFGWNWSSASGEDFFNTSMYFRYFVIISPIGIGRGPSFEQTWNPFTQGYLCQV